MSDPTNANLIPFPTPLPRNPVALSMRQFRLEAERILTARIGAEATVVQLYPAVDVEIERAA